MSHNEEEREVAGKTAEVSGGNTTPPGLKFQPVNARAALLLMLIAVGCFHAAYTPARSGLLGWLLAGYVICLTQLARLRTTRQSFYCGLVVGFCCFGPQLECFWRIFGSGAVALWSILALWIGLFVALTHRALDRWGPKRAAILLPFLWTGLEYFRSELYYLRFSWLNVGYAFAETSLVPLKMLGVYGIGFALAALAGCVLALSKWRLLAVCLVAGGLSRWLASTPSTTPKPDLHIAGVQLEFPDADDIRKALDRTVATHTNVDLLVLSEYSLDGKPTDALKEWCRANRKFLIVGGKDSAPDQQFYNTAFVLGRNGEIVFKQVKSVPIQFFKDGLPALEQRLWESPWGRIGICICYDLSYTRVADRLVRQGAQLLIVPTMDVEGWGRHQHDLHARVAPVRAEEYGLPIFRLASSGVSQGVNRLGRVLASAPFPGAGEVIAFNAALPERGGSLPLDRRLASLCVGITGLYALWLAVGMGRRKPAGNRQTVTP